MGLKGIEIVKMFKAKADNRNFRDQRNKDAIKSKKNYKLFQVLDKGYFQYENEQISCMLELFK